MAKKNTLSDVTEQLPVARGKIAEFSSDLEAAREPFRALLELTDEAVVVCQIEADGQLGRLVDISPMACLRFGESRELLLAMKFKELFVHCEVPRFIDNRKEDERFLFHGSHISPAMPEGQQSAISGKILRDRKTAVICFRNFVEAEKEAARACSSQIFMEGRKGEGAGQELYRGLFEENTTMMWMVDPESMRILDANRSAVDFYGHSKEKLLTMTLADINIYSSAKIADLIYEIGESSRKSFIACHRLASGEVRNVEVFSGKYMRNDRAVLLSLIHDVTERVHAEKQLEAARKAAESANKSKSEFLANISHEVRTPLNGVMGMLQLLQTTALDSTQKEFVDIAYTSSKSLMQVLNDLLDFSRIEAGKMALVSEEFEVSSLVEQSVKMFEAQAREKLINLSGIVEEELPLFVKGDEGRIRQILFNLIGNSFKFTNVGSIQVESYVQPTEQLGKQRLFFSVSDTGIGIEDEKINYIFESFTQVDGAFSRRHQGAGLGLAIVKRLVNLMGGNMSIESELGVGTTVLFYVLVDEVVVRQPEVTEQEAPSLPDAGRQRILVAEDEQVNLLLIRNMLERMGHEVVSAPNGQIALEILSEEHFDFVFMDIQMPEMDGLEATRVLREHPSFAHVKNVPVVALTAHAQEEDRKRAIACGMDDYIAKPFEWGDLYRVISGKVN